MKSFYVISICVLLFLSGCSPANLPMSGTQPSLGTTQPPLETKPTEEVKPTNTATLFARSTPTSERPLSIRERDQVILDLLKNNENCKLPCFLTIEPGHTSEIEALSLLDHLGINVHKYPGEVDYFSWKENGGESGLSVQFYIDNSIVKIMTVDGYVRDEGIYKNYSFDHSLDVMGNPDEIGVGITSYDQVTESNPTPLITSTPSNHQEIFHDGEYTASFNYTKVGLLYVLDGYAEKLKDQFQFCPKKDMDQYFNSNQRFYFILQSPTHQLSIGELGEKYQINISVWYVKDGMGMDSASFMKKYLDGAGCFTTPISVWKP
jgi:hypothetical protein